MTYAVGILIAITLNLCIALGGMDILMMLIVPVHEQRTCFHVFVSSSVSFPVSYNFMSTGLLHPWLNLFLGIFYSFIFSAITNGFVFLVSIPDSSLLVYTNATDFWVFILHPAALLNL